jgi:hypothetical protein
VTVIGSLALTPSQAADGADARDFDWETAAWTTTVRVRINPLFGHATAWSN